MKKRLVGGVIGALTLVGAVIVVSSSPAGAAIVKSNQVALIESAAGPNGGTIPTTGYNVPGTPFPTNPNFHNVSRTQVDSAPDFLSTTACGGVPCDTAILVQICNMGDELQLPNFKADLTNFINGGGKLLIWDSGCSDVDYGAFPVPFHTLSAHKAGINGGTMTMTEPTDLGTTLTPSASTSVNFDAITGTTNAALNANQFFTTDPNWCVAISATNGAGATNGGVVNYAKFGQGLVVYTGLDMTNMTTTAFTPANSPLGPTGINRLLMNQLALGNTNSLRCTTKAQAVLTLTPKSQTQVVGQTAPLTAHLVSDGVPVVGGTVTLSVTSGPDTNLPPAKVDTDANGDAKFTYVSAIPATNTLTATAGATQANIALSDTATVTWTGRITTPTTTPPVTATPTFTG
jgi:hypothetical protein